MLRGSNKCKVRIGFFIIPLILINCTSKVQKFEIAPGFELSDLNQGRIKFESHFPGITDSELAQELNKVIKET